MFGTWIDRTSALFAVSTSAPSLKGSALNAVDRLLAWHDRARSRRMLRSLDDRMLRDLGISRCDADQEGGKAFWR